MPASILRRATFAAASATIAGLGVLAASPASAVSAELDYTCTFYGFPEGLDEGELDPEERKLVDAAKEGEVPLDELAAELPEIIEIEGLAATAAFDSAIADGATTTPGSTVELEPVAGTVVLSAEIRAEVRKLGITEGFAGALLWAEIEETSAERETEFFFDEVSIPESGSLALSTEDGVAEAFRANAAGTFTYAAGDFELFIAPADEESAVFAGVGCTPNDDQDLRIDQIVAVGATTPAPTTPEPVRPGVVQTDAAQPISPTWLPLAAAGVGSIVLAGAASRLAGRARRN